MLREENIIKGHIDVTDGPIRGTKQLKATIHIKNVIRLSRLNLYAREKTIVHKIAWRKIMYKWAVWIDAPNILNKKERMYGCIGPNCVTKSLYGIPPCETISTHVSAIPSSNGNHHLLYAGSAYKKLMTNIQKIVLFVIVLNYSLRNRGVIHTQQNITNFVLLYQSNSGDTMLNYHFWKKQGHAPK